MTRTINILSIDGGGAKGVLSASMLNKIEQLLPTPLIDYFDLYAGSSSGGIIALGLTNTNPESTTTYTAKDIKNLFFNHASTIFSRTTFKFLRSLNNITEEKYSSTGLESTLTHYFHQKQLKDCLKPTIITAYELTNRKPKFFKSFDSQDQAVDIKTIAQATSAAPSFFEPVEYKNKSYIDGGIVANNPALCAYIEAKKQFPDAENIHVLSIGSGEFEEGIKHEDAKSWGLLGWSRHFIDIMLDGPNDAIDHQLNTLTNYNNDRYLRLNPVIPKECRHIDNADKKNLKTLIEIGDQAVKSNEDKIKRFLKHSLTKELTT